MCETIKVSIVGRVQGVGFRPFVFQLAEKLHLKGTVQNNMDGVEIYIEGNSADVKEFLTEVKEKAPRLSRIDEVTFSSTKCRGFSDFSIIPSKREGASKLVIPIDSAVCSECLTEMNDPLNFRYRYPFINCTQCGPRYTIIDELPYDRPYTSMASFDFCDACEKEYNDPLNRRHHAQPIACRDCVPQVFLFSKEGKVIESQVLSRTIELLEQGKIIAVKGIGGYHLCCNARDEQAVERLRQRKNRPNRPLAVMSSSLSEILKFASITSEEQTLLESPEAPIVVLKKNHTYNLAAGVAPNMTTVGVMLPYTPLHHLIMQGGKIKTLVMTSANPSGHPIIYKDEECKRFLGDIADYYLIHNREILHPVDDSVIQVADGFTDFFRRSRGYVPDPLNVKNDVDGIIAFGGQQKSTFSIGRNHQVFIGPHIGDLENEETIQHYQKELEHLLKWIDPPKRTAVVDYHPGYQNRHIMQEYQFKEIIEVQHHHAHMVSCMAENEIDRPAYGIILDGTGYGLDGHIWGFEIMYGDAKRFDRLAHLMYSPLPGVEKCIVEPWRNAAAMLLAILGERGIEAASRIFPQYKSAIPVLEAMIRNNMNTVYAGTCGRLFDAVSALIGVCEKSSYDGEAAILLSELADINLQSNAYSFDIHKEDEQWIIDFSKMIIEIYKDVLNEKNVKEISNSFHETIVQAIVASLNKIQRENPKFNKTVVLSGGSMHNRYIKRKLIDSLSAHGLTVYTHKQNPCNDGGLSYGQLIVASALREE